MPTISIIVPVYNKEEYLKRCVDSITAQTLSDYELILVDDGSTDLSGQICDEYAEKDSRITVIHQKNAGVSSARNAGLTIASGEFVCFCDSDDKLPITALEEMFLSAAHEKADLVIGGIVTETINHSDRTVTIKKTISRNDCLVNRKDFMTKLSSVWAENNMLSCCGKLYSLKVIQDYALQFNEKYIVLEDFDFVLRFLDHIDCLVSISSDVYCVCDYTNRQSFLHRARTDYADDVSEVYHSMLSILKKWDISEVAPFWNSIRSSFGAALQSLFISPAESTKEKIRKYRRIKDVLKTEGYQDYNRSLQYPEGLERHFLIHGSVIGILISRRIKARLLKMF